MMDHSPNSNVAETTKRTWADPATRARRLASIRRSKSTPEFRAKMSIAARRSAARRTVVAAGLPLWKWLVDLAVEMLAARTGRRGGTSTVFVIETLRLEFARRSWKPAEPAAA